MGDSVITITGDHRGGNSNNAYQWTDDGTTWVYGYDGSNRLKSAAKTGFPVALAYDALGRMRRTAKNTFIVADWLYDGTDMVGEYASGSLIRRYVHGPGIDEPLVWYEGSGTGNKTWLYGDHQGSIAAIANSAGTSTATYSYGPYGELNATSGIRFRYTGQFWLGEIGLYYYKARFYSPVLGRFLQTDPVGYQSDLNLYAYVGNDPVNRTDPPGLLFVQIVGGAVNAGVGALVSFASGDEITVRNLLTDFAVGAASSGAAGLGKLGALAQITNSGPGKALTAIGGEVYKGISSGKPAGDIGILAAGAGALNVTNAIGNVGALIAQKSGLSIASNPTANAILNNAFSTPAAVGAGVAIGNAASNLGIATASAAVPNRSAAVPSESGSYRKP